MTPQELRNDIQGLRSIAVLSVIIFHLNKYWLPGGFIGVDMFFVISGFLITGIILARKHQNEFSLISFYTSRIKRIVPAYLVLIIVIALCAAILFVPKDFDAFRASVKSVLYFNSNTFFAKQHDYFGPAVHELPLLHTWSLAIEMQFYLLLPVLLLLTPRRWLIPSLLLLTAVLLGWSEFRLHGEHQQRVYFSLLARIPEFLFGSLAALVPRKDISSGKANLMAAASVLLIAGSFAFIAEGRTFPGLMAIPACLGTSLLLLSRNSLVNRILALKPLVFIGTLSYSLYLWHWPILAGIRYVSGAYELTPVAALAFIVLTGVSGYLSYRWVESPFRRRMSTSASYVRLIGVLTVTLLAVLAATTLSRNLVEPLPDALTRYGIDAELCHSHMIGDCIRGERTSQRTLLMLGDSHAAQLNYFADVVGNATHARIRVISSSNCVTIPGFDVERIAEWGRADCRTQIEEAGKYTPTAEAIILAGMWQFHTPSTEFLTQLERFLSETSARNQRVLLLAQVPMLKANPLRIQRAKQLGLDMTVSMHAEWASANEKVKAIVARHDNATFLDLSQAPLFTHVPMLNGTLIYSDANHLNEVGSKAYGEVAAPYVQAFIDRAPTSTMIPQPSNPPFETIWGFVPTGNTTAGTHTLPCASCRE